MTAASWVAGVGGGIVLLGTFAAGVKAVPGCLEDGDLALLKLVRARRGRGPGAPPTAGS